MSDNEDESPVKAHDNGDDVEDDDPQPTRKRGGPSGAARLFIDDEAEVSDEDQVEVSADEDDDEDEGRKELQGWLVDEPEDDLGDDEPAGDDDIGVDDFDEEDLKLIADSIGIKIRKNNVRCGFNCGSET
jgi:hypothetical protein